MNPSDKFPPNPLDTLDKLLFKPPADPLEKLVPKSLREFLKLASRWDLSKRFPHLMPPRPSGGSDGS